MANPFEEFLKKFPQEGPRPVSLREQVLGIDPDQGTLIGFLRQIGVMEPRPKEKFQAPGKQAALPKVEAPQTPPTVEEPKPNPRTRPSVFRPEDSTNLTGPDRDVISTTVTDAPVRERPQMKAGTPFNDRFMGVYDRPEGTPQRFDGNQEPPLLKRLNPGEFGSPAELYNEYRKSGMSREDARDHVIMSMKQPEGSHPNWDDEDIEKFMSNEPMSQHNYRDEMGPPEGKFDLSKEAHNRSFDQRFGKWEEGASGNHMPEGMLTNAKTTTPFPILNSIGVKIKPEAWERFIANNSSENIEDRRGESPVITEMRNRLLSGLPIGERLHGDVVPIPISPTKDLNARFTQELMKDKGVEPLKIGDNDKVVSYRRFLSKKFPTK